MKLQVRIGVVVCVDPEGRLGYGTSGWRRPGKPEMTDTELLSWAREGALEDGEEVKACIVTAFVEVDPHVEYVAGEVSDDQRQGQ